MLLNNKAWQQAALNLNLDVNVYSENLNIFTLVKNNINYFFSNYSTPFNTQSVSKIFQDKGFTYDLLKESVKMPKTKFYLDPNIIEKYQNYVQLDTPQKIVDSIYMEFGEQFIIKPNRGSSGTLVSLVKSQSELEKAVLEIFANTKNYDYGLVAQEYLEIQNEYRVIAGGFLDFEVYLIYKKDNSKAVFKGNLSPLHWSGAKAVEILDKDFKARVQDRLLPVWNQIKFGFVGVDMIETMTGELYLLEVNSQPNFEYFVRDNGLDRLVEVFQKVLDVAN